MAELQGNRAVAAISENPLMGGKHQEQIEAQARQDVIDQYVPPEHWKPMEEPGKESGHNMILGNWPPNKMAEGHWEALPKAKGQDYMSYNDRFEDEMPNPSAKFQFDKETASSSIWRLVRSIVKNSGERMKPAALYRLVSTLHTPLVPDWYFEGQLKPKHISHEKAESRMRQPEQLLADLHLDSVQMADQFVSEAIADKWKKALEAVHKVDYELELKEEWAEAVQKERDKGLDEASTAKLIDNVRKNFQRKAHKMKITKVIALRDRMMGKFMEHYQGEANRFFEAVKAQKLDYEASPGPAKGTYFARITEQMNRYLKWAKAAQDRGFNVIEPMGDKLKSPRDNLIKGMYQEWYHENQTPKAQALARKKFADWYGKVPNDYVPKLKDVISLDWFSHLVRAYEVMNGIGSPEALKQRTVLAEFLDATREKSTRIRAFSQYKLDEIQAAQIIRAWESGDLRQIERYLHVEKTAITEAVGEAEPEEGLMLDRSGKIVKKKVAKDVEVDPEAGQFEEAGRRQAAGQAVLEAKRAEFLKNYKFSAEDKMLWTLDPKRIEGVLHEVERKRPESLDNIEAWEEQQAIRPEAMGNYVPGDPSIRKMHTATDLRNASNALRRVPMDLINSMEYMYNAKLAHEKGDVATATDLYQRGEIAFASAIERAWAKGESEFKVIEALLTGDAKEFRSKIGADVGNLKRGYAEMLVSEMYKRRWIIENKAERRIFVSNRLQNLIQQISHIRERTSETRWTAEKDIHYGENGGNPMDWICHSPCNLNRDKLKEIYDESSGKFKTGIGRLVRLWTANRSNVMSAISMWGRQIVEPGVKGFTNSIINRMLATDRNRLGDLIANTLSKYNIEKTGHEIDFKSKYLRILKESGFDKLQAELHDRPEWENLTSAQQIESLELQQLLRVLDGRPGNNPDALSDRAKQALPKMREFLVEAKQLLASHIFRHLRENAEQALADGTQMTPMRRWRRMLGDITDPQQVLDILKHTIEADPGAAPVSMHGIEARGWGLQDYYPHIWRKSQQVGDAFTHARDPGADPDADMQEAASWLGGEKISQWKKEYVEDYARRHGFMGNTKRMANLLKRLGTGDGYIEDLHWTMDSYIGRMMDKVYYERLNDDLTPLIFGELQDVDTSTPENLMHWIKNVPGENTDGHHSTLGGVDHHFGMKLTGNLKGVGYRALTNQGPIKAEKGVFGKEQRALAEKRWRRDLWRVVGTPSLEGWDHADAAMRKSVNITLSNGSEQVILWGKKTIQNAGLKVRKGGLTNYREGHQYAAIKDLVLRATGYNVDTGAYVGDGPQSAFAKSIKHVADITADVFYHTQLGGYINTKAGSIQLVEGTLQNLSALGPSAWKDALPIVQGSVRFNHYVLTAKDPVQARKEAILKFANDPYVRDAVPIFDAAQIQIQHLLGPQARGAKGFFDQAKRISYASFTLADVATKEMAYYGAYKKAVEVGEWTDPTTGEVLKVTPDYIPVGQMYKRYRKVISAHDVARMIMERTHFTLPKWGQPGLVRMKGWGFVGHLGTQATNISAEFWYGMGAMLKYAKTGDPVYEFQAKKAGGYMAALFGASVISSILGKNMGAYVGQRPQDVGFDEWKLGKLLPFLKALPDQVRIPAWQPPGEAGLPAKFWFSTKPEQGVIALASDAMVRWQSGQQPATEALMSSFRNWWNTNSRTLAGRQIRPIAAMLTAQPSDLDPERPWKVRDPWWFGPEGKTRYRSTLDLYGGDLLLPGWSSQDSSEHQRAEWSKELSAVHGAIGRELRRNLRSDNEEVRDAALEALLERGYKVDPLRIRKAAIMDDLPSGVRLALGGGTRVQRLMNFARDAADWTPSVRELALRYILPEQKKPNLSDLPEGLWDSVIEALEAE